MLEIVFGDSACASLKIAQSYGQGAYQQGCTGVIASCENGKKTTRKEIRQAQREAQARECQKWQSAVPMGGKTEDVYGFGLALSYGDISEEEPGELRQNSLERMYGVYKAGEEKDFIRKVIEEANRNLKVVLSRAAEGEALRIWYSNQPDELCGFYWFMNQLNKHRSAYGPVFLIQLPEWEYDDNKNMVRRTGWGGIEPGEWYRYIDLQKPASPAFCQSCAGHWEKLQKENAPLRAVLNVQLISAPINLYDDFIKREIAAMPEQFHQAEVIGRVLGYGLGIGDALAAERMENMIRQGLLEAVTSAPDGMPLYHRILRQRPEMFAEYK